MVEYLFHTLAHLLTLVCTLADLASCAVIINEVNPDNPGWDTMDFFELYNTDASAVSLDGYVVVFWQGGVSPAYAYNVYDLSGLCIDGNGFFLIGREAVIPKPNFVGSSSPSSGLLQNGGGKCDAVALYKGNPADYVKGMTLTKVGLVDAVVYEKVSSTDSSMFFPDLLPSQTPLFENDKAYTDDESLSRCTGNDPLNLGQFQLRRISPGSPNLCNDNDPLPTNVQTPPTTCKTTLLSQTAAATSSTDTLTTSAPINRDIQRGSAFSTGGFAVHTDRSLQNHSLSVRTTRNLVQCIHLCVRRPQCLSVNFSTSQTVDNCQLNSVDTHEGTVALTVQTGVKYAESKLLT